MKWGGGKWKQPDHDRGGENWLLMYFLILCYLECGLHLWKWRLHLWHVTSSSRSCTRLFENFLHFFDHETSRISKQENKMMQNKRTFGSWVASQEALVLGLEPDQILLFSRWSVKKIKWNLLFQSITSEIMFQPLSIHLECTWISGFKVHSWTQAASLLFLGCISRIQTSFLLFILVLRLNQLSFNRSRLPKVS
jgi:hypothetical protein